MIGISQHCLKGVMGCNNMTLNRMNPDSIPSNVWYIQVSFRRLSCPGYSLLHTPQLHRTLWGVGHFVLIWWCYPYSRVVIGRPRRQDEFSQRMEVVWVCRCFVRWLCPLCMGWVICGPASLSNTLLWYSVHWAKLLHIVEPLCDGHYRNRPCCWLPLQGPIVFFCHHLHSGGKVIECL